ncbi:MAG: polyprenyl synthetase family protein [bacterium]
MNIQKYLSQRRIVIDKAIPRYIPRGEKFTRSLHEAIEYSLMSGGKRIRPILTLAACEAVSGKFKDAIPLAVAIEMIHTYTLIHDDLPAMDNDDMRRGKPTCHKVFGEDVAILAGDMLNTLAFEIIAESYGARTALIISEISKALGIRGVVGGQIADLKSKDRKISLKELEFIGIHKTACLFIACVRGGAIVGGASREELSKLTAFATHLGLAFQIIDDILDHKPGSKDNYPALLGMSRSRSAAKMEINKAVKALPKDKNYSRLKEMAFFLAKREE